MNLYRYINTYTDKEIILLKKVKREKGKKRKERRTDKWKTNLY